MTNRPLLSETALTLKVLCTSCGLLKTGPKRLLVQRLRHAAKHFQPIPPEARILSIDLGLKNFAFSLLTPATIPPKHNPPIHNTLLTTPVHLHAWKRLDLTLPPSSSSTSTTTSTSIKKTRGRTRKTTAAADLPSSTALANEENANSDPDKDAFSPQAMAHLTLNLIQSHLLPLEPTHVLIERQRFRTGGAAAIFEWTLRVNTLEAMLHAVFASLNSRNLHQSTRSLTTIEGNGSTSEVWDGLWAARVESVLPRAVSGFLFPGDSDAAVVENGGDGMKKGKKGGAANAYKMLKRGKVDVLGRLLKDERMVMPQTGQAGEMVRLFLGEWEKKGAKSGKRAKKGESEREKTDEVLTKMDDLSDAVLQGMAWLQWQRNLEALIKERPELLEDEAGE